MTPWELLATAPAPAGGTLTLHRRGAELSLRVDGRELMNSRVHASEEALARLACAHLAGQRAPRVLVGGLGMGFTLGALLAALPAAAAVVVAELVGAVVDWNRTHLAALAGRPLDDGRVEVRVDDVARVLAAEPAGFDAIVLDVDNGPGGLTQPQNDRLYAAAGLGAARAALRPGGALLVWSAAPDRSFAQRLGAAGFVVRQTQARAGGARHVVWTAVRAPAPRRRR